MHNRLRQLVLYIGIGVFILSPVFVSAQQTAPLRSAQQDVASLVSADDQFLASFGSFIARFLGSFHFFGTVDFGSIASTGSVSTTCPYGTAYADGCPSAPSNGIYQDSHFFTDARQSGQAAYEVRPPWNVAGVDYPVGYDKTLTLQNPATASLPQGCEYDSTGSSTNGRHTGPTVSCGTNAGTPYTGGTISGLNFTDNGCTWLYFGSYSSGTTTITNNHFGSGPNCNTDTDNGVGILGGTYADVHMNIVFSENEVEELYNSTTKFTYLINAFGFVNDGVNGGTHCETIIQYNYIHDLNGNFASGNNAYCTAQLRYNVYENFNLGSSSHGAFFANTATAGSEAAPTGVDELDQQYNVCDYTSSAPVNYGTTCFSNLGNEGGFTYYTTTRTDHNTIVTNLNGGLGGNTTVSAAVTEVLRDMYISNMYVTNNYVDPTGAGSCFINGGDGGGAGTISNESSGAGSTLTLTSESGGAIYPGGGFGNSTGDVIYGYIAPYGTVSFDTGTSTTGLGLTGTYTLCSDTTCAHAATSTYQSFSTGWATLTSYVPNLVATGNINMLTGNPVTIAGAKWDTGSCK